MIEDNELPTSFLVNSQKLSFIASLNQKVSVIESQGKEVIKLSGGDPSHVPEKLLTIMQELNIEKDKSIFNYSPIAGIDSLRELLAAIISLRYRQKILKDNILVCSGGCSGLFLTLKTILNPGDRVLIQNPCWEYLPRLIENCAGTVVKMNFSFNPALEYNWDQLFIELKGHLENGIKIVTINSPLNPSGTIIPFEVKNVIIKLCQEYNAWVISDDVTTDFNYIEYNNAIINNENNFISVNSFSKNLGVTGLRFGFVVGCEKIINQIKKTQLYTFMYPNSLIQRIIELYLSSGVNEYYDFIHNIHLLYKIRAKEYSKLFSTIPGIEILQPDGGLFLFPKIKPEYKLNSERLLEQHNIAVAPGVAFGEESKNYFRVFLGVSSEKILKAVQMIKREI